MMTRAAAVAVVMAGFVAAAGPAEAQWRNGRDRGGRQDAARAQGVPPGQMPPPDLCRVWYDNRPPGRQPSPTYCDRAEAVVARERQARVVYGENVYWRGEFGRDGRGPYGRRDDRGRDDGYRDDDRYGRGDDRYERDNDRAVPRDGRVRDPRLGDGRWDGGRRDDRVDRTPAYDNGYRDGLSKGREDAEDRDRYDVDRHSWYRAGTRGYERRDGDRSRYQSHYRAGFEDGYAEGYRLYARR